MSEYHAPTLFDRCAELHRRMDVVLADFRPEPPLVLRLGPAQGVDY